MKYIIIAVLFGALTGVAIGEVALALLRLSQVVK